jgi:hypothetical protein
MIGINYNAQTKEVTEIEVPDVETPIVEPIIDADEQLQQAIESATNFDELKLALTGKLLPNQHGKAKAKIV